MDVKDFNYELPQELIAQDPLEDRSSSRLLVLDKDTGAMQHKGFRDILSYLHRGDCLVINDTKVIPARLIGSREGTDGKIEVLLLKRRDNDIWETLVKPGKKAKTGTVISFGDGILKGTVVDVVEEGNRLIQFAYEGIFEEILDRLGQMPLPPYITHQLQDKNRYQTVYAKHEGSAAAPTAGLHFTKELLREIEEKGVQLAHVTLHVGLGTFRPVKVENVLEHHMHSEFYVVEEEEAAKINETKGNGGRVVCVGTTSCRTLESATGEDGVLRAGSGWTEIFIYPGYRFKILDCLITNFHLPESTLIMLVSALAGREHTLNAYQEAVKENYRFFSFGDAMFIAALPADGIRLNKMLSESGVCSRREADRLIEAGKVFVDGQQAVMGMKIQQGQAVVCDGKNVTGKDEPVLLAVNKPRGIVCTTSDKDRATNIVEFIGYPVRIYPVGRLDKDSEGLLLMTNQGDVSNRILKSRYAHEKEYLVTVDQPLTDSFLYDMGHGVNILDTVTRPCVVEAAGEMSFKVILTQGLNRQIRRMCEALGYQVKTLKRVRIMNLKLGNLKTGEYRRVTDEEWRTLKGLLDGTGESRTDRGYQ